MYSVHSGKYGGFHCKEKLKVYCFLEKKNCTYIYVVYYEFLTLDVFLTVTIYTR